MSYWAGYNLKVDLNGVPYAVGRVVVRDSAPAQDVSNTEGLPGNPTPPAGFVANPAFSSALGGQAQATVELVQPTFDNAADPFGAPLAAAPGSFVPCIIYLTSRGPATPQWNFANLLITEGELNHDVKALEPLTLRGVSDGAYTRP